MYLLSITTPGSRHWYYSILQRRKLRNRQVASLLELRRFGSGVSAISRTSLITKTLETSRSLFLYQFLIPISRLCGRWGRGGTESHVKATGKNLEGGCWVGADFKEKAKRSKSMGPILKRKGSTSRSCPWLQSGCWCPAPITSGGQANGLIPPAGRVTFGGWRWYRSWGFPWINESHSEDVFPKKVLLPGFSKFPIREGAFLSEIGARTAYALMPWNQQ